MRRVSEGIRLHAKNDLEVEDILPLVFMSLRASVHTNTCISHNDVLFGRTMPVADPVKPRLDGKLQGSAKDYAQFVH